MNKRFIVTIVVAAAVVIMTIAFYPKLSDQQKDRPVDHTGNGQDEVEYYTCAMHPSVKSPDPGKCPICGMELTPVFRKTANADTMKQLDLTFGISLQKRQLIGVKTSEVSVRPMTKVIRAAGRVDFDERRIAVVNLKVMGWIKELFADYTGQRVHKGQPLFTLYSPELVSTQEEYLQAMKAAEHEHEALAEMQPVLHGEHARLLVASSEDVLRTARQRLLLWDITPEQIANLEKTGVAETYLTITSPIGGHVIQKEAVAGMNVMPGMTLYKISDLGHLWVYADVYEYELPYIKIGQEALVYLQSSPGERFSGEIAFIYPYLNAETRTARVRIDISNRDGRLKPEMYAEVQLTVDLGKKVTAPESAVLNTGTRQLVFVDQGEGSFEARVVTAGVRSQGYYEIIEGLHAGEQVVAAANFLVDSESKLQGVLQKLDGIVTPAAHQH